MGLTGSVSKWEIVGIWSLMVIYIKRSGRNIYGRYFVKDLVEIYMVDISYKFGRDIFGRIYLVG